MVSNIQDWLLTYQPEGSTLERILWIFWAVWLLFILAAVFRVIKFRFGLNSEEKLWRGDLGAQSPAAIIVPIKGVSPNQTSDFFQSLLEQDYKNYRLIVTVEAADDPAAVWLSDQFQLTPCQPVWSSGNPDGLQSVQLVIAGKSKSEGQKVYNQLAAFERLTNTDEIVVFVDADIQCPPDWLAKLTYPINNFTHDISTTYRWLVPEKATLANRIASVINASVTTQGGNTRDNMPWGGSTAIGIDTFRKLDVPNLFTGCLNDDLRLGKAAKKAGYKVGYLRSLVRPTDVNYTWSSFFEFARRQYLQAKFFSPILYFASNLIFSLYFWGFVSIAVAIGFGYLWGWVPLIAATLLDQLRATTRESIYRKLFGHLPDTYKRISKCSIVEHFMTLLYMSIHGLIVLSTWFMNKMEWGGVKYKIGGIGKTKILDRKPAGTTPDLTSIGQLALPAMAGTAALAAAVPAIANATASSATAEKISEEKLNQPEKPPQVPEPAKQQEPDEKLFKFQPLEEQPSSKPDTETRSTAPEPTPEPDKPEPEKIYTFQSLEKESSEVPQPEPASTATSDQPKPKPIFKGIGSSAIITGAAGTAAATAIHSITNASQSVSDSASNLTSRPKTSPSVAAVPHAVSAVRLLGAKPVSSAVKLTGLGAELPSKNQFVSRLEKLPYFQNKGYQKPFVPGSPIFVFKKML